MKIIGIIPARAGSKGIPNKNIKILNGKPLLQYTSDVALKTKLLDKLIISTDSKKIADTALMLGLEVPFLRPISLSQSSTPTLPVIKHALNHFIKQNIYFDAVCLLQVTSPTRTLNFLEECIKKFINSKCDSLISVKKVPDHYNPHWCFEPNDSDFLKIATGEKKIISRRQDLPESYFRDGSVYLTKSKIILEKDSLFGESIAYNVNPESININIDTLKDWELAQRYFSNEREN